MTRGARYRRLEQDYTDLLNLAAISRFIHVTPQAAQPGWPPERYHITYTCRGIERVDDDGTPVASELHQVSLYLSLDYPLKQPYLRWLTPIWHPNIQHEEPYHVCTNEFKNWWGAKPLEELAIFMGEMVQYRRYHALWVDPYPFDEAAAQWVREYAEPNGIVGPDKPFDDRSLVEGIQIFQDPYSKVVRCARCDAPYEFDTRTGGEARTLCDACNAQEGEQEVIVLGRPARRGGGPAPSSTPTFPAPPLPGSEEAGEDQVLLGSPRHTSE